MLLTIDAGSDAVNLSTTAVKNGSNYVLNGRKAWCVSVDFFIVVLIMLCCFTW